MGSVAMIYSFIKIGSGIQKLTRGIHRHTDSMVILYAYFKKEISYDPFLTGISLFMPNDSNPYVKSFLSVVSASLNLVARRLYRIHDAKAI
jgi:hypothetical protein